MPSPKVKPAMMLFEYFQNWDDTIINQCCNVARIKKYPKDQIILGDSVGFTNYVYFVLRGECKIMEELPVLKSNSKKGTRYKLYMPKEETVKTVVEESTSNRENTNMQNISADGTNKILLNNNPPKNLEVHFVQVCILSPLSCIGFGEQMERRRVITTVPTECLLIPLYWLMQRNVNNTWGKIQIFLKRFVPATEHVFEEFVSQKRWNEYRQKLTYSNVSNKKRSSKNFLYNVPYYIRINEIT